MKSSLPQRLTEVAVLFLKLGMTAFGGPAAHIAMMHDETVKRRKWLSDQEFLDLVGATNLIPGPNSTEMAIHVGFLRAGWPGLLIGGLCFILPAMLIVMALAWIYVRFGAIPQAGWLLYGVKPVVIAIIVQALWTLGQKAIKDTLSAAAAVVVIILYFAGINEIALLFAAGLIAMFAANYQRLWMKNMGAFFIHETDALPQVGIFPIMHIPTGDSDRGLGGDHVPLFLPIWVQKSWGPWTTYGGGGYWSNPGEGNKNFWQLGWLGQREITKAVLLGAEIFYFGKDTDDGSDRIGYGIGGVLNVSEDHHILFSVGRDIAGHHTLFAVTSQETTGSRPTWATNGPSGLMKRGKSREQPGF